MDLAEARTLIGSERLWLAPGGSQKLLVGVLVLDARISYGRSQLQIQPLSGRGVRWVEAETTQEIED